MSLMKEYFFNIKCDVCGCLYDDELWNTDIENFKCEYVHQYQHLLRLCGLDDLANNFKVV